MYYDDLHDIVWMLWLVYINCSNWTIWTYKCIMMSYTNEKNTCIYVVYSWMIQCLVYVMFHLNSGDTCIGMAYANDRDI